MTTTISTETTTFILLPDGRYSEAKVRIEEYGESSPPVKTGRIFRRPIDMTEAAQTAPENRGIIYNPSNFTPEYIILDIFGQDI